MTASPAVPLRHGLILLLVFLLGCRGPATAPPASPTAAPTQAVQASATTVPTLAPTATVPATQAPANTPALAATAQATPAQAASPQAEATATPDPAVAVVHAYIEARAKADVESVTALSCSAWKPQAITEAISFRSMNAQLQGVACQPAGAAGAFALVHCSGKIITTYGTETREWDLENFVYQAAPEDGAWKMCGYQ